MKLIGLEEEKIKKIFHSLKLCSVEKIQFLENIQTNAAFSVNDKYIIRFNIWEKNSIRFHRFKMACDHLYSSNVSVPQVITLDETKTITPYDFIILLKIPGIPLNSSWNSFSLETKNLLAKDIGRSLANIHTFKLHRYGDLVGEVKKGSDSWLFFLQEMHKQTFKEVIETSALDIKILNKIKSNFIENKNLFTKVKKPVLLHGNLESKNILHQNGKFSGFIDFNQALAGDPEFDFKNLNKIEKLLKGFKAPFLEGYSQILEISERFNEKIKIYETLNLLRQCCTAKVYWTAKEHQTLCLELKSQV